MAVDRPQTIVGKVRHRDERTREVFWTPERLAAAKPARKIVSHRGSAGQKQWLPPPIGEGGCTPHHLGNLKEPAAHAEPMIAGALGVAQPLSYPYRTIGKLFFTQKGELYGGSAVLIAPNVLLTAAHCVYDDGAWSAHVEFYPSYPSREGNDPFYRFGYHSLACWGSWIGDTGNYARDYAMVWVDAAPGQELGFLGLEWLGYDGTNLEGRRWEAVGYPVVPNPPFDGSTMDHTVGSFVEGDQPGVIGMSNDNMGDGASGGPWLTSLAGRYVNGVTSHTHDGESFTSFSPFFTSDVFALYKYISNPANR